MTKKLQRKSYNEAFRREAVRLSEQPGRNATEVARELGIHPGQIYNWRTQFNKLSKHGAMSRGVSGGADEPRTVGLARGLLCVA